MKRALAVLPLSALLLAAAGCGDDGPTLEERRQAYLTKAEAVCKTANDAVSATPQPTDVAGAGPYADRLLEVARTTITELSAVDPPAEDRDRVQKMMLRPLQADLTTAQDYVAKVKAAAAANDAGTLLTLIGARPQTTANLVEMRDYGFSQCVLAADTRN